MRKRTNAFKFNRPDRHFTGHPLLSCHTFPLPLPICFIRSLFTFNCVGCTEVACALLMMLMTMLMMLRAGVRAPVRRLRPHLIATITSVPPSTTAGSSPSSNHPFHQQHILSPPSNYSSSHPSHLLTSLPSIRIFLSHPFFILSPLSSPELTFRQHQKHLRAVPHRVFDRGRHRQQGSVFEADGFGDACMEEWIDDSYSVSAGMIENGVCVFIGIEKIESNF